MMVTYPKQLISDLCVLRERVREVGWKISLAEIGNPRMADSWQLTKYLAIGATSVLVFYAAYGTFRAGVELTENGTFTRNRLIFNTLGILIGFIPTNYFTYWTNKRWVFQGGKHAQKKEFLLFTLVAASSFLGSQEVVWWLI